jgi:hypothetical protein
MEWALDGLVLSVRRVALPALVNQCLSLTSVLNSLLTEHRDPDALPEEGKWYRRNWVSLVLSPIPRSPSQSTYEGSPIGRYASGGALRSYTWPESFHLYRCESLPYKSINFRHWFGGIRASVYDRATTNSLIPCQSGQLAESQNSCHFIT